MVNRRTNHASIIVVTWSCGKLAERCAGARGCVCVRGLAVTGVQFEAWRSHACICAATIPNHDTPAPMPAKVLPGAMYVAVSWT